MYEQILATLDPILSNPTATVGTGSAIIAVCALLLAVYTGLVARRHYRTSVRPYLIHRLDRRPVEGNKASVDLTLANGGLGPAVIKKYKLKLDGKLVNTADEAEFARIVYRLFGHLPDRFETYHFAENDLMRKDEKQPVFAVTVDLDKLPKWEKVDDVGRLVKLMDRFSLEVRYRSLYGERFRIFRPSEADKWKWGRFLKTWGRRLIGSQPT
jgi:hypothetical protein